MLNYIVLGTFTEKGSSSIKETTKRADAVKELGGRFGGGVRFIGDIGFVGGKFTAARETGP